MKKLIKNTEKTINPLISSKNGMHWVSPAQPVEATCRFCYNVGGVIFCLMKNKYIFKQEKDLEQDIGRSGIAVEFVVILISLTKLEALRTPKTTVT